MQGHSHTHAIHMGHTSARTHMHVYTEACNHTNIYTHTNIYIWLFQTQQAFLYFIYYYY